MLEAWTHIREQYPDYKLVLAGKGKLWFDQRSYDNEQVIWLHRYIENHELSQLIQNAAFVLAPYTDATHSSVVMTAFAFNKPVLSTHVGGLPEVVRDGITGWTVPPKDATALRQRLDEILQDPQYIAAICSQIEKMEESAKELDWSFIRKQYKTLYQSMVNKLETHP